MKPQNFKIISTKELEACIAKRWDKEGTGLPQLEVIFFLDDSRITITFQYDTEKERDFVFEKINDHFIKAVIIGAKLSVNQSKINLN